MIKLGYTNQIAQILPVKFFTHGAKKRKKVFTNQKKRVIL